MKTSLFLVVMLRTTEIAFSAPLCQTGIAPQSLLNCGLTGKGSEINTRGGVASRVDLRIHNRREKYDPAISHTINTRDSASRVDLRIHNRLEKYDPAISHTDVYSPPGEKIEKQAEKHIGSTKWSYAGNHETGANTNKCNIFVADVLKKVGTDAPNRYPVFYTPIGANEWANPNSKYLKRDPNWKLVTGDKKVGDVIAANGHVGIVTGNGKTTSASAAARPRGKVVENDWGFRPGQNPTAWRYVKDKK